MTDEERRQGPKTTKRGFFYHETSFLDRRWTQMNADGAPPRVPRPTHLRGLKACPFSHPSLRVRMQEETSLRRATEGWIGLSALGYSLGTEPGARAPGWYKAGPLARFLAGFGGMGKARIRMIIAVIYFKAS